MLNVLLTIYYHIIVKIPSYHIKMSKEAILSDFESYIIGTYDL